MVTLFREIEPTGSFQPFVLTWFCFAKFEYTECTSAYISQNALLYITSILQLYDPRLMYDKLRDALLAESGASVAAVFISDKRARHSHDRNKYIYIYIYIYIYLLISHLHHHTMHLRVIGKYAFMSRYFLNNAGSG